MEFKRQLLGWCVAMGEERSHVWSLAGMGFGVSESLFPAIVDGQGCVRVKTNRYSTPLGPGIRSEVVLWPNGVLVYHGRECVAGHERCYGRGYEFFQLEHHLDALDAEARSAGGLNAADPVVGRWTLAGLHGPAVGEADERAGRA